MAGCLDLAQHCHEGRDDPSNIHSILVLRAKDGQVRHQDGGLDADGSPDWLVRLLQRVSSRPSGNSVDGRFGGIQQ